jgi:hypothetical protein
MTTTLSQATYWDLFQLVKTFFGEGDRLDNPPTLNELAKQIGLTGL